MKHINKIGRYTRDIVWVLVDEYTWQRVIATFIAVIVGILTAIYAYKETDRIPATAEDYEELNEQLDAIQKNPELLFVTDCEVVIKDEIITITLANSECKLVTDLNKNFKKLGDSEKIDLSFNAIDTAFTVIMIGGTSLLVVGFFIWCILWGVSFIVFVGKKIYEYFNDRR